MPKKAKWRQRIPIWTPLERAVIPRSEITKAQQRFGLSDEEIAQHLDAEFWKNDRYQVQKRLIEQGPGAAPWVWLSIHRLDRAPCRDWRDFQRIKNQLVGAECEGIELYPAESRLVDAANEYHVICSTDPAWRFPFGFQERLVSNAPGGKAKQRPHP